MPRCLLALLVHSPLDPAWRPGRPVLNLLSPDPKDEALPGFDSIFVFQGWSFCPRGVPFVGAGEQAKLLGAEDVVAQPGHEDALEFVG
eukprot:6749230-Pyramimonas_sp.AAC.1